LTWADASTQANKEEEAMEDSVIELSEGEIEAVKERIAQLKVEHRDLDDVIGRLLDDPRHDELQMRRLKRRKLLLKDQIALLERQLNPDIPA
jgi:hypothetical protein